MKRTHVIILIASLLLLVSTAAIVAYLPLLISHKKSEPKPVAVETTTTTIPEPPKPQFRCPLDGEVTTEQKSQERPLAVMIENHVGARPQSGLAKACTVYETVAEGGITRFMAVFLHNDADIIGPVRSAREYFVDLSKQYDAIYSHCGGPATIYNVIKNLGVANLDEFSNSDAYWRTRDRRAPHNLYTSTAKLRKKASEREFSDEAFFQRPNFKDDDPLELRPTNASIDLNFSRPAFSVHYEYDRATNRYNRFMAGKPHVDAASNEQIMPKNVVVQYVPIANIANDPKGRLSVSLIGTGQAIVFQDGKAIQATWKRPALADLTRFYGTNDTEIKLNRGQTWIELIDSGKMQVSYE